MSARYELQRTCKRDGTNWYVSLNPLDKMPKRRLESFAAKSAVRGNRLLLTGNRGAGEAQMSNFQTQQQRMADQVYRNTHCPSCGSQSFTSKKVKV